MYVQSKGSTSPFEANPQTSAIYCTENEKCTLQVQRKWSDSIC